MWNDSDALVRSPSSQCISIPIRRLGYIAFPYTYRLQCDITRKQCGVAHYIKVRID